MRFPRACAPTTLLLGLGACQPLPPIEYETDRLAVATDFDAPVCAGTLRMLDTAAGRITAALRPSGHDDQFIVYWLEHDLQAQCDDDASGCFYPGTGIVFARAESIAHEIVHATIDSPGEEFFVEEGIAELYGGAGVRHDPRDLRGQLAAQLSLSRHAYDHGHLSYPQAAHFAHWLREAKGPGATQRLASALARGDGATGLRDQLESIFGRTLSGIERQYEQEAPRLYPGVYDDDLHTERLGSSSQWLEVDLRCDDDRTMGPLPGAVEGMVRLLRLEVPDRGELHLRVEGDPQTRVELLDPYASSLEPTPPWAPALEHAGRLARVGPGERTTITVDRGTYLLAFTATSSASRHIELQLRR